MSLDTSRIRNPELKKYADDHFNRLCRMVALGAVATGTTNKIVTSTNMKVGTYTIAAQPDVCRNITVTATAVDAADTMGTITIAGTNALDETISEAITPVAGSTVAGEKCFKTVTSVTGAGWVIGGGNDTVVVGTGTKLGLPFELAATSEVLLGVIATTLYAPTVVAGGTVEKSNVIMNSGTYAGNTVFVFVVE